MGNNRLDLIIKAIEEAKGLAEVRHIVTVYVSENNGLMAAGIA